MEKYNVEQQILDFINKDYSRTTFATRLYELFCKHDEAVKAYIKVVGNSGITMVKRLVGEN